MEKEMSHILDEAEAIINDPSESVERKKEAQTLIQRAIEKVVVRPRGWRNFGNVICTFRGYTTCDRYKN
jgi:hypothetical protein